MKNMIKKIGLSIFTVLLLFFMQHSAPFNVHSFLYSCQHTYYKLAVSFTRHPDDLVNLGSFYVDHGKYTLAEPYLLEGAEKGGKRALEEIGLLYTIQDKWEQAIKYLMLAVDQEQSLVAAGILGVKYAEEGQSERAKPYCLKAVDAGLVLGYFGLGIVYLDEDQLDLAEGYFLKAWELRAYIDNQIVQTICDRLGSIYYLKGDLRQANDWLKLSNSNVSQEMQEIIQEIEGDPLLLSEYHSLRNIVRSA